MHIFCVINELFVRLSELCTVCVTKDDRNRKGEMGVAANKFLLINNNNKYVKISLYK